MGEMRIAEQLVALLLPAGNLIDAAAGILVQRNVEAVDQLRIPGLDEIGHVFGVVLGGFGDVVTEALHDLVADHIMMLFGALGGAALDLRVKIDAVLRDLQQPGLMVDAGNLPLNGFVIFHAQALHQTLAAHLHAVAQTHGLDAGIALHRAGKHGHGIGIIEEPRVRADLFHVLREIEQDRDGSQRAENAADAEGVGDGLAQTVFFRNFEVGDGAGIIAADLNGVHDVICAAQGFLALLHAQICLNLRLGAVVLIDDVQHQLALIEAGRIDIIQRDGGFGQRRGHHAVAQHVLGKYGGTGAHKGNFRHNGFLLIVL